MHIGILQTDHVLDQFQGEFGNYPSMFQDLLRSVREDLTFTVYDVQTAIPSEIVCDAYLITGSRHSVYDDFPWIQALVDYLKEVLASEKKILGICFGHQLMAHYFGGCVGPADAGWAVGVHTSDITREPKWMGEAPAQVNLVSSHKDQVKTLPEGAEVYATNDFCPIAGFTLGEQIWTIQGHPEFAPEYSRALMNYRREIIGEETYQGGVASLHTPTDAKQLAQWMLDFVEGGASS